MDPCQECGSTDVRTEQRDGVVVHECGLCGAIAGDAAAVRAVQAAAEAREHGVDARIWPLVRVLRTLPGIRVERSHAGDPDAGTLPFVHWQVLDPRGLAQLENVAKTLLLAARGLALHWVVEVEYQHHLVFALKPRAARADPATAALAAADLEQLPRILERDSQLSWWRR